MTNTEINRATASAQTEFEASEPYVSISKSEWTVLRQVCQRSFRLYAELKWLANFKTGVVGTFRNQQLTYEGLAEMVSLPVRQGVSASHGIVDGKEIKRLLERLEAKGLVADCFHDGTKLTMTLPMSPIRPKAASKSASKTKKETQTKKRGVDSFLMAYFEQEAASPGSDHRRQDAASYGGKLPPVAEKLPTDERLELAGNLHEDSDFDDFADSPSVLVANTDQYLSVPESVQKMGEAVASPSTSGACDTHAPPPPLSGRQLVEGVDAAEGTMGELEIELMLKNFDSPPVLYMQTKETRQFIRNMEAMRVEEWEIEQAVEQVRKDPTSPLTPAAILRELHVVRIKRQQRNARGLGGRVAL